MEILDDLGVIDRILAHGQFHLLFRSYDGTTVLGDHDMQPMATFEQPLHLTGEIAKIEQATFILATGWTPSPFPPFYDKAKAKGWRTATMESCHDVMLDLPEELTRELLAVSARRSASAH